MLDDVNDHEEIAEKVTLTEKEQPKPTPLCTLMSDGSLKVLASTVTVLEVQRAMLQAIAMISDKTMQRAVVANQILIQIRQRYDGLDDEITQAMENLFRQE